jgi:calpain
VVIDDYLPTRNGKLIYVKSATENEFWPALLEKAYAKLYGSYESIKSGSACEAMVDFSGGCSEIIHEIPHTQKEQDNLYNHMLKTFDRSSMITCYIYPDEKIVEARTQLGLIKGHAYSVTKVLKAKINKGRKKGLYPLVRVRNPWGGDVEWKGDWSDHSTSWKLVSDEDKNAIGLTFEHDGEFYMSQNDFMTHFDGIELTHLMPNSLSENEMKGGKLQWNEIHFNGAWIRGKNAGGCRNYIDTFAENPQYLVAIEDGDNDGFCTTVISLMQKGTRERKAGSMQDGSLPIGNIFLYCNIFCIESLN